jgi:hypothetical protein
LDLSYPAQSDTPLQRLQRRLRKLAGRLGPRGVRPRGMHLATFLKLRARISEVEQEVDSYIYGRLARELADLRMRP